MQALSAPQIEWGMKKPDSYILTFQDPHPAPTGDRQEKIKASKEYGRKLQEKVAQWIRDEVLDDKMAVIGEPLIFPFVFVRCPDEGLASRLDRIPGVVSVEPDQEVKSID